MSTTPTLTPPDSLTPPEDPRDDVLGRAIIDRALAEGATEAEALDLAARALRRRASHARASWRRCFRCLKFSPANTYPIDPSRTFPRAHCATCWEHTHPDDASTKGSRP